MRLAGGALCVCVGWGCVGLFACVRLCVGVCGGDCVRFVFQCAYVWVCACVFLCV